MTRTLTRPASLPVAEHLYDALIQLTDVTDYGMGMQELMSAQVAPPPQGARLDIAFEGRVEGPKLSGSYEGVDYAEIRADGKFRLHLHGTITTDDGARIAFFADGICTMPDREGISQIRENVTYTTASDTYAWLNSAQGWATGTANMTSGEVKLKAFIA